LMSLPDNALKWMADELASRKDASTLETGYGLTTVLMTMLVNNHCSIAPDEPGYQRILAYCTKQNISVKGLRYYADCSEKILPTLNIEDESLDMVLIDGGHGFPVPFVDYMYTFKKVSIGGHLIIDDMQLVTGLLLKDVLIESPEWSLTAFFGRTCAFKKIHHTESRNWTGQPYLTRMDKLVKSMTCDLSPSMMERLCLIPSLASHKWTERRIDNPATLEMALIPIMVCERLKLLKLTDGITKVAIFGDGKHTEWLERVLAGKAGVPKVVAILDDASNDKPKRFGLKPINPKDYSPEHDDAIILSSDCSQMKMRDRCRNLYGETAKLIDLYEGLPCGPYKKV